MNATSRHRARLALHRESDATWNAKIDRIIATSFSVSCMSDTKWRKAFRALAASSYALAGYRWKFVHDNRTIETPVVRPDDLEDQHLRDGSMQPFVYREIEWVEVLTEYPNEVISELAASGRFAVEQTESGFRLFGYR